MNTEKKIGFFEEAPGVKSSMRLNAFIMLIFFCLFTPYYTRQHEFTVDFVLFETLLLLAIFVPKALQKVAELRFGNTVEKRSEITVTETEKKP